MSMKDWLYRLQPVQLYIVLVLSIVYFLAQLFLSHITHALTLLVNSYHMLCNILALTGCILAIKHSNKDNVKIKTITSSSSASSVEKFVEVNLTAPERNDGSPTTLDTPETVAEIREKIAQNSRQQHERSLKNTFGWTRIDVLSMLIVCIFMASLCFSMLIEALQTLSHIDHQDAMHHPIPVLVLGSLGLVLNGLCYLLIGGYTYHQGSFLHITPSGNVILDRVVSGDGVRKGERRLSKTRKHKGAIHENPKRQSVREMFRDVSSTIFVIICSIIVYLSDEDEEVSKYVDPLLSIVSCILLLFLSYPYMKESCLILLQTIPDTIDIECFKKSLLESFVDIVNVHDLHIWQLSANKYVSTAHIIFQDPKVYATINEDLVNFFHDQGINIVTIQPEFILVAKCIMKSDCLMQCREISCLSKHCCPSCEALPAIQATTNSVHHVSNEIPSSTTSKEDISSQLKNISTTTPNLDNISREKEENPETPTSSENKTVTI